MLNKKKSGNDLVTRLGVYAGITEIVHILIASFMMAVGNGIFMTGRPGGLFAVMSVLVLFVLSAIISVALLLGYPAFLLINKKSEEATLFVGASLATLFGGFIILLLLGSIY